MRSRRVLSTIGACAVACLMLPSAAQADNTTCANADFVWPGERASDFVAASSSVFFKTRVTAGRSYAVVTWGPFQDAGDGGVILGVNIFSDSTCTAAAAGVNSADYEPLAFGIPSHSGDHDNVIPAADGSIYIEIFNAEATGYTAYVLVIETTIFSPWWFAGGTANAFIEIRNNMTGTTTAEVTAYRSNGTVCGTSNVVISGNGNAAVHVNSLGTCAAAGSGSAQIAFAGTPGGLVANITTIDAVNGTSFDAPFSPRFVYAAVGR